MELIAGGKKAKPDYVNLYTKALIRSAERLKEVPEDKQAKLRTIFYGVKLVNAADSGKLSAEGATNLFALICSIKAYMEEITPQELMQMFPLEKVYNGQKWGSKDYPFAMKILRQHGLDKPLGKNVQELLWDYMSDEITDFVVATMVSMDKIRRYAGEQTLIEEFAEERGVKLQVFTMTTDGEGRKWLTNDETGERQRVKVKRPKYLRPVSGI